MFDSIEFVSDWYAEVQENGVPDRLRQVAFRKGSTLQAQICQLDPVANENETLADLRLLDGTKAYASPSRASR